MHQLYENYENGFVLTISQRLYARPAVIKALYHFHKRYLISYELESDNLKIFFEPLTTIDSIPHAVAEITEALDLQMIRYDTMHSTNEIRQLMVARALYTSCIEPEHEEIEPELNSDSSDWQTDSQAIFNSWAPEKAE